MDNLNEQQKAAVTFGGKHLLVLAGAGTGKTRTIISRAKYLIHSGVSPKRILILSFTRKSAAEIVERISSELTSSKSEGLTGQTFHSWCMSILKSYSKIFPQASYTLLDEDDQDSCFKLLCGRKWNVKNSHGKRIKPEAIKEVYSYAVNARCSLSRAIRMKLYDNASDDLDVDAERKILQGVIAMYLEYKKSRKYIDYDDILLIVSQYLKANPKLRHHIATQYDHILVDEMQDTNPLQYELLSSFYEDCHLFCVGDDAQSIYAFRGADFRTIHNFTKVVPDSEVKKLTINYRSTQEILDLSNWVLSTSPLNYDKNLTAYRGQGVLPQFIHWDDEWEEANDITDKIQASLPVLGYNYRDNLVLSRSVWRLKKVESCCLKKKIPYTLFGGRGLMSSKHVRDVVAPMRIVSNYLDEIAWSRYLQLWKNIGAVSAAKIIGEVISANNLDDSIQLLMSMNLQREISLTLERLSTLQFDPSAAIGEALEVMADRLQELYQDEWEWRKNDFPILQDVAKSTGSISEFVAEYILDPKLDLTNKGEGKEEDHVILSTIHSAKGLEASSVYLTNASVYSYPTPRAILNGPDAVEEERRCLYVALTRAKDRLYVYRDIHSIHVANDDSQYYFFHDVPETLYESVVIAAHGVLDEVLLEGVEEPDIYGDFKFD